MNAASDKRNGQFEPRPTRARGFEARGLTSFLTIALLMIFLIVTIGLWSWAAWWGVTKLIGLLF